MPRLLASLSAFLARGGEMLVLDTGSDDGTPEIAAAAGCRVFVEPRRFRSRLTERQAHRINRSFCREGEGPFASAGDPLFNFGKARAHAAALARNHFQFAVDGRDVVDRMDIDFLDRTARSRHPGILFFETRVLNPGGWALEVRDYLYDRRLAKWGGRSHNYLLAPAPRPGPGPALVPRDRLRVSHHTNLAKARSYHVLAALDALAEPHLPRWEYFLARELIAHGYPRSAGHLFLGLDRPAVPSAIRSAALCFAAQCEASSGASQDQVETLLFRAFRRDSTRRDPLLRLAEQCLREGNMQGAASFAAAALAIPPRVNLAEPEENHSIRPHAVLYWALLWLGRRDEARVHFEACRKHDPMNPVYQNHAGLFRSPPARGRPGSGRALPEA